MGALQSDCLMCDSQARRQSPAAALNTLAVRRLRRASALKSMI
jgi:hypothetical protein